MEEQTQKRRLTKAEISDRLYVAAAIGRRNCDAIAEVLLIIQSGGIESPPEPVRVKSPGEIAVHEGGDEHAIVVDGYFIHIRKPELRSSHIEYLQKFINKMVAAAVREDRESGGMSEAVKAERERVKNAALAIVNAHVFRNDTNVAAVEAKIHAIK